ncbi:MAG: DUF2069 domain-containing protein [Pseudomonadales bacterium]|nr:DUF2069 domain-containing protein [Pseudomonadales bacterium]
MNQQNSKAALTVGVHTGVLLSYYGLILFFGGVSLLALESIRFTSLVIWLIQIAPLLPFAWGLHRQHRRSLLWLCLVVLLYFMHGVLVAFDPERRWQGLIQIALCCALFVTLTLSIRLQRTGQQTSEQKTR